MACLAAALALGLPAGASGASTGEITRAQVGSDWTTASIAGMAVRSGDCQEPPIGPEPPPGEESTPPILPESPPWTCGWIPFATIGPGSSQSDCSAAARRWDSFGDQVQVVWVGQELKGPGSAGFDLNDVALERGADSPLLCLAAVEAVGEVVGCLAVVGVPCPPYEIRHHTYQLDSALLEIVTAPVAREQALSPPGPKPCKKERQRLKRPQRQGRVALGPGVRVQGKAKRVRRCKTG